MEAAGVSRHDVTVAGEPSPMLVDRIVSEYRSLEVEVVLAIGGGSVIDTAKAVAGLLPFGNSVMDHLEGVGRGIPYTGPSAPCIAVPTTAGTGSEATKNSVLSVRGPDGFKKSFRHDSLVPAVAVVDPVLTFGCPPDLTAAAGMDALTQLAESYVSTGSNPFTDALALSGLAAVRDGLLAAYEGGGDRQAEGRAAMSYAALLSGITLTQAGLGIVHGLAAPLGAFFPIPHGIACAALLSPAARANIKALKERVPASPPLEKYAKMGSVLSCCAPDSREEALDALIRTLSAWTKRLQIPGLARYGVREADLGRIVAACVSKTNPVPLTEDEMFGILRESL